MQIWGAQIIYHINNSYSLVTQDRNILGKDQDPVALTIEVAKLLKDLKKMQLVWLLEEFTKFWKSISCTLELSQLLKR